MLMKAQRRDPEHPPDFQKASLFFPGYSATYQTQHGGAYRRAFAGNALYYRNKLGFNFCHFYHLSHKQAAAWPSLNRCVCLTRIRCFRLDTPSLTYDHTTQKILYLFSHSNNTLWGSLDEPDITNTNEFEDLFSKATLQPKKKPLSDTYEKKAKAKKVKRVGVLAPPLISALSLSLSFSSFSAEGIVSFKDLFKRRLRISYGRNNKR